MKIQLAGAARTMKYSCQFGAVQFDVVDVVQYDVVLYGEVGESIVKNFSNTFALHFLNLTHTKNKPITSQSKYFRQ